MEMGLVLHVLFEIWHTHLSVSAQEQHVVIETTHRPRESER